jgi:hypothetical protein
MTDAPFTRGTALSQDQLREVLADIIDGRIVKRAKHSLSWGVHDCTFEFLDVLKERGYQSRLVRDVQIEPGERVPAFYVDSGTAFFGWIFWEKFSQLRLRKLFGSVVRNDKGDWAVQIPEKRNTLVYVNQSLKSEMDIDSPSGF